MQPELKAEIESPPDLKLDNIYPYASLLEKEVSFNSINYQVADITKLVKGQK